MKGFDRPYPRFSLCGLKCGLCPLYQMAGGCPGCGGGAGNQSCAIARCSLAHGGVEYCWQCGEYPCERYAGFFDYDSFLPVREAPRDIRRCQEIGMAVYQAELDAKVALLEELLSGYNDGRKKTLYCTAVNRLDLTDIRAAVEELRTKTPGIDDLPARAATAVQVLQALATQPGISLSLRRKPRKNKKRDGGE